MSQSKIVVGIDIGDRTVKVLVAESATTDGKRVLRILGTGTAGHNGMRRGFIEDNEEVRMAVGQAINSAEKAAGTKIRQAELSISEGGLIGIVSKGHAMVARADREVTSVDLTAAQNAAEANLPKGAFQNKRILHRIPLGTTIDGEGLIGSPLGMKGSRIETRHLFVACSEQNLSRLVSIVERFNIDISGASVAPIAASLACLSKTQKMAGCLLAVIGAETTSLAIYEDGVPIAVEILPLGGQDITNDIALGLKVPLEEAESIKVGAMTQTDASKKKLDLIIRSRLEDIFDAVEVTLKKVGRSHLLPAGVFVTGGSAKLSTITESAKETLRLPAKVVTVPAGQAGKNLEPLWSVAYGLCLIAAAGDGEGLSGISSSGTSKNIWGWLKQFLP